MPNGIEIEEKENIPLPQEVKEKIPEGKFIIGYSGTVGIANNLDYLLDAAEILKENNEIHFIILGNGGEKQRLQKRVKALSLTNVTFLEAIPKEEIDKFFNIYRCCIYIAYYLKIFLSLVSLLIRFLSICMQKNLYFGR